MKRVLYLSMILLSISIVVVSCKDKEAQEDNTEASTSLGAEKADLAMNAEYQCPMDCENGKTYDKEGECPECKMALKKVDKSEDRDDSDHGENHDKHEGHDHN